MVIRIVATNLLVKFSLVRCYVVLIESEVFPIFKIHNILMTTFSVTNFRQQFVAAEILVFFYTVSR